CLATGVVLGLGSKWGLVRYWWVAIKLVLNLVLTALVVVALRGEVAEQAELARRLAAGEAVTFDLSNLIFPPTVSPTLLLVAITLSGVKRWGRIRRGEVAARGRRPRGSSSRRRPWLSRGTSCWRWPGCTSCGRSRRRWSCWCRPRSPWSRCRGGAGRTCWPRCCAPWRCSAHWSSTGRPTTGWPTRGRSRPGWAPSCRSPGWGSPSSRACSRPGGRCSSGGGGGEPRGERRLGVGGGEVGVDAGAGQRPGGGRRADLGGQVGGVPRDPDARHGGGARQAAREAAADARQVLHRQPEAREALVAGEKRGGHGEDAPRHELSVAEPHPGDAGPVGLDSRHGRVDDPDAAGGEQGAGVRVEI